MDFPFACLCLWSEWATNFFGSSLVIVLEIPSFNFLIFLFFFQILAFFFEKFEIFKISPFFATESHLYRFAPKYLQNFTEIVVYNFVSFCSNLMFGSSLERSWSIFLIFEKKKNFYKRLSYIRAWKTPWFWKKNFFQNNGVLKHRYMTSACKNFYFLKN